MIERRTTVARAEAGFTLLELLIALVVFSLLMTLLVNGLQLTAKSWRAASAHSSDQLDRRSARQALRRQLQQAVPYRETTHRNGIPRVLFEGKRSEVTFVGRLPDHVGGVMQLMRFAKVERVLQLRSAPVHPASDAPEAWSDTSPLLEDVQEVVFSYFDDHGENGGQWVDHWKDQIDLPEAIKIEIAFLEEGADPWPPLIVQPMISCAQPC